MKTRVLLEYLKEFDPDSEIALIAASPDMRKLYEVNRMFIVDVRKAPVIGFEIVNPVNFTAKEVATAEADEAAAETSRRCEITGIDGTALNLKEEIFAKGEKEKADAIVEILRGMTIESAKALLDKTKVYLEQMVI